MSKKRLEPDEIMALPYRELRAYALKITREHAGAQRSINRLRAKLRLWEEGTPPAPHGPHHAHRGQAPVRHRRIVYREARDA